MKHFFIFFSILTVLIGGAILLRTVSLSIGKHSKNFAAVFVQAQSESDISNGGDPSVQESEPVEGTNREAGQRILALLDDLRALSLDEAVFSDPLFLSLTDFSTELEPEPKGRENPFAPIFIISPEPRNTLPRNSIPRP